VSLQLPTRPRLNQVLKESYLLVLGELALLVSNKLIHQLQNPLPPMSFCYPCVHHSALANLQLAFAGFTRRGLLANLALYQKRTFVGLAHLSLL
jgi:hypothetical protein